jgi:8-amino-3,8-dideoxy-alpha-D-manno-octulosonate transaminase
MGHLRTLPYGANYLALEDMRELREAIDQRILFRYLTLGESAASRLERHAAERFGTRHALAVHNCTEGLRLALLSTRPRVGDVVHIPAVTFVAVAGAVLSCGLVPRLVDVDEDLCLDPAELPPAAERVIVVHLDGAVGRLPSDVPYVIEDVAQALGGRHPDGRATGAAGCAGVFSFHHNKLLTSGEGGLIITDDGERLETMRRYSDHGCMRSHGEYPRWQAHAIYGENCVTGEAIAAIQLQQFRHLDRLLAGLERGHRLLHEALPRRSWFRPHARAAGDVKLSLPIICDSAEIRDRLAEVLRQRGSPYWTLDRYFLPTHPVMHDRGSVYADGFPWNLAGPPQDPSPFAATAARLSRRLCLCISPELDEAGQLAQARSFAEALGSL